MYRAITWAVCWTRGVDLTDPDAIAKAAGDVALHSDAAGADDRSRRPRRLPPHPPCRRDLECQPGGGRACRSGPSSCRARRDAIAGAGPGTVVEGRDIGAAVASGRGRSRLYLVADATARARRCRASELGQRRPQARRREALARRDHLDSSRTASPLAMADDAILVDGTGPDARRGHRRRGGAGGGAAPVSVQPLRPVELPEKMLGRLRRYAATWLDRNWTIRTHGESNVPSHGPVILAANHIGWLDGPVLFLKAPRPAHALVKRELFVGKTGRFLTAAAQIPVNRTGTDVGALRTAAESLLAGQVVIIYPEGRRGDGEFRTIKGGAAWLSLVSGAPVVPIAIFGTRAPGRPQGHPTREGRCDRRRLRRADHVPQLPPLAAHHGRDRVHHGADREAPARAPRRRPGAGRTGTRATRAAPQGGGQCLTCPSSPSSGGPTSASRRWSIASSAAARPSSGRAGVTRDRVPYDADWNGRAFKVVDTGGWDPGRPRLAERIAAQAEVAVQSPTPCCSWSTPRSASPMPTRRSWRFCGRPTSR